MSSKTLKTVKLKTLPQGGVVLVGRGILSWLSTERVSDRYGSVFLMADGETSLTLAAKVFPPVWVAPPDQPGRLICLVSEPRESTHIGDMFRCLYPRTPKVGDILVLGDGLAFSEIQSGRTAIGVKPVDGRASDWLNPRALYDVHESYVELYWEPTTDG